VIAWKSGYGLLAPDVAIQIPAKTDINHYQHATGRRKW